MNQSNNDDRNQREFSWLARFIIWCACADKKALKTCSNKVMMKYVAMGCLILVPAILALPSATFFLKTALFPNQAWGIYPAVAIGLVWSWVVFCLDRYFVLSFDAGSFGNTTVRQLMGNIAKTIARLSIAALISFILAEPLVLKLFEPRLLQTIAEDNRLAKQKITDGYEARIAAAETAIHTIRQKSTQRQDSNNLLALSPVIKDFQDRITSKRGEISQAQTEYSDEVAGGKGSRTGKRGEGTVALTIKQKIHTLTGDLQQLLAELAQAKAGYQKNQALLKQQALADEVNLQAMRHIDLQVINQKAASVAQLKQAQAIAIAEYDQFIAADFLSLSEALDTLSREHFNVRLQKWLLTGLLFLIDVLVLVLKALSGDDEYRQKESNAQLEAKIKGEIKQQAFSETLQERIGLQVRHDFSQLHQQQLLQVAEHNLQRMVTFSTFIKGYSEQVGTFQGEFVNSPHYQESLLKEYLNISERLFDEFLAKLNEEEQNAF